VSAARSSSGRRPPQYRRPSTGGRPSARPAGRSTAARAQKAADQPAPLPPGEARRTLTGLALFAIGFAVAGLIIAVGLAGTPGYYIMISIGLIGIAVLGFSSRRVVADVQPPPVWSPAGLTRVADGAGVPARLVVVTFYALIALSVLGNVVLPLMSRR
jgi:hypothetical protein